MADTLTYLPPSSPPPSNIAQDDPTSPAPVQRLFYAVFADETARDAAWRISKKHDGERDLGGSRLFPNRYHVTLAPIGDYERLPQPLVDFAIRVGDHVAMKQFRATFTHAESFRGRPGHHPYVLLGDEGIAGFHLLRMAIGGAMLGQGLDVNATRFTPHLTLLYGKKHVGPLRIPPVSWVVRDFALVLSHVGETRYEILKRWRLADAAFGEIS